MRPWLPLLALILLAEVGSAGYRLVADVWHAGNSHPLVLRFPAPDSLDGVYHETAVDPRQVGNLSHDHARRYLVSLPGGVSVEVLSIEYNGGNRRSMGDLYQHRPECCMGYAGAEIREVYPEREIGVSSEMVRVLATRIGSGSSGDRYIFRGTWVPGEARSFPLGDDRLSRMRRAFHLHPSPPALIHMAGIEGVKSYEEACRIFEEIAVRPLRRVNGKR